MQALRLTGLAAACAVALFAGCASDVKLDPPPPVETRTPTPVMPDTSGTGGTTMPAPESQVTTVDLAKSIAALDSSQRVVYFDFDSYIVKDDYRPVVQTWSKLLASSPSSKATVAGHTDSRGGTEYNLALGQKRAEAVVKTLGVMGVPDGQVEAVSYGKERPAVTGSDEAAFAKNRRAELAAK